MKTTLDLPDEIVRQLKMRAVRDRRKLKDVAAEMLRNGLHSPRQNGKEKPATVSRDKKTGLPIIRCKTAPATGRELTPQRVADILSAQDAQWVRGSH
jgi:plasmid stability protein